MGNVQAKKAKNKRSAASAINLQTCTLPEFKEELKNMKYESAIVWNGRGPSPITIYRKFIDDWNTSSFPKIPNIGQECFEQMNDKGLRCSAIYTREKTTIVLDYLRPKRAFVMEDKTYFVRSFTKDIVRQ